MFENLKAVESKDFSAFNASYKVPSTLKCVVQADFSITDLKSNSVELLSRSHICLSSDARDEDWLDAVLQDIEDMICNMIEDKKDLRDDVVYNIVFDLSLESTCSNGPDGEEWDTEDTCEEIFFGSYDKESMHYVIFKNDLKRR